MDEKKIIAVIEALGEKISQQEADLRYYKWQFEMVKDELQKAKEEIEKIAENQRKDIEEK